MLEVFGDCIVQTCVTTGGALSCCCFLWSPTSLPILTSDLGCQLPPPHNLPLTRRFLFLGRLSALSEAAENPISLRVRLLHLELGDKLSSPRPHGSNLLDVPMCALLHRLLALKSREAGAAPNIN